jgi:hypothetical protein
MNQTAGTVERAYQLARSGQCRTIDEIVKRLTKERFDSPQAHLAGQGLRAQLRALMKAASTPAPASAVDGASAES